MDALLILQIIVGVCFIGLILVLFSETKDYLVYALLFLMIVAISSFFLNPPSNLEEFGNEIILAVDWQVVIFLFCLFTIVEILNEKKIFQEIALKIVNKYNGRPRVMFYALSITSTLIATVIEDLSVAIIFIPIVIEVCRKMEISPTPYMYGVTICINLASTLTPFGSAENIIMANQFDLPLQWYIIYLGLYFVIALVITLFLLDRLILTKYLKGKKSYQNYSVPGYFSANLLEEARKNDRKHSKSFFQKRIHLHDKIPNKIVKIEIVPSSQDGDNSKISPSEKILRININKGMFRKNLMALIIFIVFLFVIPNIVVAGILGVIIFIFINPIELDSKEKKEPSLSHYLRKIDAKLIYFFIILFLMVFFMEQAELTLIIEHLVENLSHHNVFLIAIGILIITSLLSGFLDNAPVTILFIPIIVDLIGTGNYPIDPLLIAFTLGINLGGNFLPQGAACDMMTLDLAKKNNVTSFSYKNLAIIGGFFALIHVLLGIGYIYVFLRFFS